jgi:hypothetical protein
VFSAALFTYSLKVPRVTESSPQIQLPSDLIAWVCRSSIVSLTYVSGAATSGSDFIDIAGTDGFHPIIVCVTS